MGTDADKKDQEKSKMQERKQKSNKETPES